MGKTIVVVFTIKILTANYIPIYLKNEIFLILCLNFFESSLLRFLVDLVGNVV